MARRRARRVPPLARAATPGALTAARGGVRRRQPGRGGARPPRAAAAARGRLRGARGGAVAPGAPHAGRRPRARREQRARRAPARAQHDLLREPVRGARAAASLLADDPLQALAYLAAGRASSAPRGRAHDFLVAQACAPPTASSSIRVTTGVRCAAASRPTARAWSPAATTATAARDTGIPRAALSWSSSRTSARWPAASGAPTEPWSRLPPIQTPACLSGTRVLVSGATDWRCRRKYRSSPSRRTATAFWSSPSMRR